MQNLKDSYFFVIYAGKSFHHRQVDFSNYANFSNFGIK